MCLQVSVPIRALHIERRSLVSCSVILLLIPLSERKSLNLELGPFVSTPVAFYLDVGLASTFTHQAIYSPKFINFNKMLEIRAGEMAQ